MVLDSGLHITTRISLRGWNPYKQWLLNARKFINYTAQDLYHIDKAMIKRFLQDTGQTEKTLIEAALQVLIIQIYQ